MDAGLKHLIKRVVSSNSFLYFLLLFIVYLMITQSVDRNGQPFFLKPDAPVESAAAKVEIERSKPVAADKDIARQRSTDRINQAMADYAAAYQTQDAMPDQTQLTADPQDDENVPLSEQDPLQAKDRVKPAPLEPRAEPYALMVNSGSATVRFSVRVTGDADPSTTVYLRQSGAEGAITMNDQGVDGDVVARDNIHGANIVLDTSRLQPDTCLSYIATVRDGESETVSSPLNVCVSNLPVRTAASNTDNPVVFSEGLKAVADEILVTAQTGTKIAAMQALAASINATIVGSIPPLNLYQLKLSDPATELQLAALVVQLNARPEVKGASVNAIGQAAAAPNDPEYVNQHGLQLVRAQDVWDIGATGTGVIVTVLDTGIDRTHPDFGTVGNCQLAENDCGKANTDVKVGGTQAGHGTMVAGVIAAKFNNMLGIAGVAPGSKIHSIRLTDFTTSGMIQGFSDAAAYGVASVINASFYGQWSPTSWTYSSGLATLCTSINSAVWNGVAKAVVVNAVGNDDNKDPPISGTTYTENFYPARCNDSTSAVHAGLTHKELLITVSNSVSKPVAACGTGVGINQRCNTSNYGAWVDIAAPGSAIRTTALGRTYASPTGTSFSSPMVAGAAAILKSCGVPLNQIESTLRTSANVTVPFPNGSSAPRLDIYRALKQRNRAPTGIRLSKSSLQNGLDTSLGVAVGNLIVTDLDKCDKFTYRIIGGVDAALFSISGIKGNVLRLKAGVLNNSVKPSYSVKVRVTDFGGVIFDKLLRVSVI